MSTDLPRSLKILFLCKRHYMGKDVIADRYGRLFYFPHLLAGSGHEVTCLLSDYHLKTTLRAPVEQDGVTWISTPLVRTGTLLGQVRRLAAVADVIIGSSDALQVCLAHYLAKKYEKPCVVDLYDNYESFGLSRMPFVKSRYRKALRRADAVTCVGDELRSFIEEAYAPAGVTLTLNSTIPEGQFYPVDEAEARRALGLAAGDRLVGICGGLIPNRGIGCFYRAVEELWEEGENFKLVLAGTPGAGMPPPAGERTILLGNLGFDKMNTFYNAMDLNVLQYIDNEFGRYAYPQKLEEIIATGAPLMAANIGELRRRFETTPAVLYEPEDTESIKSMVKRQLETPTPYDTATRSWNDVVMKLEELVRELAV